MIQTQLPGFKFSDRLCFGASLLKKSHAKKSRPLSRKSALHVVLKSDYAEGPYSLLKQKSTITGTLYNQAKKFGVKIFQIKIHSDHIHILLRIQSRRTFQNYLRSIAGLIARKVLHAERGHAAKFDTVYKNHKASNHLNEPAVLSSRKGLVIPKGKSFWSQRPFTRIVSWGPDFKGMSKFIEKADIAHGFLSKRYQKLPLPIVYKKVMSSLSASLQGFT